MRDFISGAPGSNYHNITIQERPVYYYWNFKGYDTRLKNNVTERIPDWLPDAQYGDEEYDENLLKYRVHEIDSTISMIKQIIKEYMHKTGYIPNRNTAFVGFEGHEHYQSLDIEPGQGWNDALKSSGKNDNFNHGDYYWGIHSSKDSDARTYYHYESGKCLYRDDSLMDYLPGVDDAGDCKRTANNLYPVSYTHLRAHET